MRYERASHVVVLDFPHPSGLDEVASPVPQVFYLRDEEVAGRHIGVLEHAGNVLLHDFVAVADYVLRTERVFLVGGIPVDEHVLVYILLVVRHPDEVFRGLAQLVSDGEMQRAGEDLRYGLGYVSLFVQHGVAYHPVAFRLFYRAYDDAALLSEQLGRAFGVICAYLDDDLRPCPLVVTVEYACRVELGIDIEENDIPDIIEKYKTKAESNKSFNVSIEDLRENEYNLLPSRYKKIEYTPPTFEHTPLEYVQILLDSERKSIELLESLKEKLGGKLNV